MKLYIQTGMNTTKVNMVPTKTINVVFISVNVGKDIPDEMKAISDKMVNKHSIAFVSKLNDFKNLKFLILLLFFMEFSLHTINIFNMLRNKVK